MLSLSGRMMKDEGEERTVKSVKTIGITTLAACVGSNFLLLPVMGVTPPFLTPYSRELGIGYFIWSIALALAYRQRKETEKKE